jgi:uncharacterized protein YycO
MNFNDLLSNVSADITMAISKVSRPEPIIEDSDVADLKSLLQDGDCLISRTEWELSNVCEKILTGSYWGHAAIYLKGKVYEATTKGVRITSLEKFCFTKDGLGLCRLPGSPWTQKQISEMVLFCEDQLGEEYDFSIDWGSRKKWYCSKLVYFAWMAGNPLETDAIQSKYVLGQKRIIPQNIWDSVLKIKSYGVSKCCVL